MELTDSLKLREVPKSKVIAFLSQLIYLSKILPCNPYKTLSSSILSAVIPGCVAIIPDKGSPGADTYKKNRINDIPNIIGINNINLLIIYCFINHTT